MRSSQNLRLNRERFFELARYWLLPLLLGFIIGLAVFLLASIYKLLNFTLFLTVNWNSLLLLASASVALLGGYLTMRLLSENKESGCGTELVIERYHFKSGFASLRATMAEL